MSLFGDIWVVRHQALYVIWIQMIFSDLKFCHKKIIANEAVIS